MAYSNYSYNYALPNIDISSLMNQGFSGASSLMGQRYEGEGRLQDSRLQNSLELARMGYGSAAELQGGQLASNRELAGLGYKSAADLQREQIGFGREKEKNQMRQFLDSLNFEREKFRFTPQPMSDRERLQEIDSLGRRRSSLLYSQSMYPSMRDSINLSSGLMNINDQRRALGLKSMTIGSPGGSSYNYSRGRG